MVKLNDFKERTEKEPITKLSPASTVYIPLNQHLGKICQPIVNIGDMVSLGQKIGEAQAAVYAPVHSSIPGKVILIEDWPHPALGRCKAVVIEGNKTEQLGSPEWEQAARSPDEVDKLTPGQIREIVFNAGIVGMGGAGFPTHLKLNPAKPVDTLIINGAECEPLLTGDYRVMLEKTKEILLGAGAIVKCLGAKNVYMAIEDNKPEAIKKFLDLSSNQGAVKPSKSGQNSQKFTLKVLKTRYPQGGEKQLIKNVMGKEVPRGRLPFDIGIVVQNVSTVFAVYEAVYLGKPLYERVVTVSGSCLSHPKNLLARLGTPIKELIRECGPLKEEPAKIIIGGPMMGIAQYSREVPVIKTTTGVILFNAKEATELEQESLCIRCGACVRNCPMGLMPCLINLSAEKGLWQKAKECGAADCVECGLCSYVCPAKRNLVQSIKRAKLEVNK